MPEISTKTRPWSLQQGRTKSRKWTSFLLDYKADPSKKDGAENSPLCIALSIESLEVATALIKAGADVNGTDGNHDTPLALAIRGIKTVMACFLLERGANPNKPDHTGNPPLSLAVECNNVELVRFLLSFNANPNEADNRGVTPICVAARGASDDIFVMLLNYGAIVNIGDERGVTPTHRVIDLGRSRMLRKRIETKADMNMNDGLGNPPLVFAIRRRLLWENKADPNTRNTTGDPPLSMAVHNANRELAGMLSLLFKANPNEIGKNNNLPITVAGEANDFDTMEMLLLAGANPNLYRSDTSQSLLHMAMQSEETKAAHLLVVHGAKETNATVRELHRSCWL